MTKIIAHNATIMPVKTVAEVNCLKFYGVLMDDGRRTMLRATEFGCGYNLSVLYKFTACNRLGFNFDSLFIAVNSFLSEGWEVYEFDKLSELALWMEAEKTA